MNMSPMNDMSRFITLTTGALLSLLAMTSGAAVASEKAQAAAAAGGQARPRICLVLSGGGARGAAHVGVLKVLEEYRVPVDCIAGTSMGSLVGAAYASGMTLDEMDVILGSISTELLFRETPPRQELALRRKTDDYTILSTPEVGLDNGSLSFGKGIVTGVQLETVLRQLSKAKGFYEFDELPIPYRAVATDLVTGKAVIFKEGELANVMRASMSVPGAVAPAEFDGMLLVDGMLTSNLPVQTAREMGADVVIAVNVGTPLLKREQLNSIFGVSGQMLSILTEQNVKESLASLGPDDILISPELGDYSTGDFDHLPAIAPLGEVAARKMERALRKYSMPADEYAAWRETQQFNAEPDLQVVDEIRFENLKRVNPQSLTDLVDTQVGQPIDQPTLDKDIRRLFGTGDFEHVSYRVLDEDGKRVLAINASEKSWGPDYMRFGLGLSSDFDGDSAFNILASHRQTWLNERGAEWRNDVQIGETSGIYSEWFQPLSAGSRFFYAPHALLRQRSTDLYQDDNRIGTYDVLTGLTGIDVGSQFNRYGEIRFGVEVGQLRPSLDSGTVDLEPVSDRVQVGRLTSRMVLDQMDSVYFPRSGWMASYDLFDSRDELGADDEFGKISGSVSSAVSFGEHTFNFSLKAADKYGSQPLPDYEYFQWGGFLQQSGYVPGQLLGENLQFGRVIYYKRLVDSTLLEGAFGGISLEAGRVGNPLVEQKDDGWIISNSVFIGTDSPVGPLYFGYGRSQEGNQSLYFYLGRPF